MWASSAFAERFRSLRCSWNGSTSIRDAASVGAAWRGGRLSMRRTSAARRAAIALSAVIAVAAVGPSVAQAQGGSVSATDPNIRYEGHWDLTHSRPTTVNSGSRIALSFAGNRLVGLFDVSSITNPPQIY